MPTSFSTWSGFWVLWTITLTSLMVVSLQLVQLISLLESKLTHWSFFSLEITEGSLPSTTPNSNNDPTLGVDVQTIGRTVIKGRAMRGGMIGFGVVLALLGVIAVVVYYYYKYVSKENAQEDNEDGAGKTPYTNPAAKKAASSLDADEATVVSEAPSTEDLDMDNIA